MDTHSFPVELSDEPTLLMSQYGAYGQAQIYKREDIIDIVKYANLKGESDDAQSISGSLDMESKYSTVYPILPMALKFEWH